MKNYLLSAAIVILLVCGKISAQNTITSYSYWFDNQATNAVTTPTSTSLLDINLNISTAGLAAGLHVLNFQSSDVTGKQSAVESRFFYKNNNLKITTYQYWFGNDASLATTIPAQPASSVIQFASQIDALSLPIGLNVLNIRFQDNEGKWSAVESRFFMNNGDRNKIIAYKYWFDSNSANATVVPISQPVEILDLPLSIPVGSPNGALRTLYLQFQDESGLWSGVITPYFQQSGQATEPSEIVFLNVLKHQSNSFLKTPKELWKGHATGINPSILKICADGSKATHIIFINKTGLPNSQIRFVPKSFLTNSNTTQTGGFATSDYSYNLDTVFAQFTHPGYMPDNGFNRKDTILLINNQNNQTLFKQPIQIYRAPVVLVHGLWGNGNSMVDIYNYLAANTHPPIILQKSNYKGTNSKSFEENRHLLPNEIDALFLKMRDLKISAGSCDIICHSMGGLLARIYLQKPKCLNTQSEDCYRGDYHRLITIGTPHFGSHLANLANTPVAKELLPFFVRNYSSDINFQIEGSAVENLAIGSTALDLWLNGSHVLNKNTVPTRIISSEILPVPLIIEKKWQALTLSFLAPGVQNYLDNYNDFATGFNDFMEYLFWGDAHDGVVSKLSQQGGIPISATYHHPNSFHINQPENGQIIQEVVTSLNISPSNSNIFSTQGFTDPGLQSHYRTEPIGFPSESGTGDMDISLLNVDSIFLPGEDMNINISASGDISYIVFAGVTYDRVFFIQDSISSSFNFSYQLPIDAYGPVRVLTAGYDTTGFIALDTLDFWVEPNASLTSISVSPDELFIARGRTGEFHVYGDFSDGIQREITHTMDYNLLFDDPSIAVPVQNNVLQGMIEGETRLFISAGLNTKSIKVNVGEGIELQIPTTRIDDPSFKPSQKVEEITLFPNPSGGKITLKANLSKAGTPHILITDLEGRPIMEKKLSYVTQGDIQHTLQLPEIPEGIYFLRLSVGEQQFWGKFICLDAR